MSDPSLPLPFATEVIHFNFKLTSTQRYRQHYHLTIDIVTGFKIQGQYPTPGGTPGKPLANSQQDPTPPHPRIALTSELPRPKREYGLLLRLNFKIQINVKHQVGKSYLVIRL
jgi:hypothetical protein